MMQNVHFMRSSQAVRKSSEIQRTLGQKGQLLVSIILNLPIQYPYIVKLIGNENKVNHQSVELTLM